MNLDEVILHQLKSLKAQLLKAEYSRGTIEATATEDIAAFELVSLEYNASTLEATPIEGAISQIHLFEGAIAYAPKAITMGQTAEFELASSTNPILES